MMQPHRSHPLSLTGARTLGSATLLALCILACASALAAAPALALPASFGTEGEAAGQVSNPQGVAVDQESGDVYVGDARNARVEKFGPEGEFLLAWGWGVADGKTEALQTCTTTCFKGLEGAGAGEFAEIFGAEGIAVNNDSFSPSHGDVYVVDSRNLRVQKFDPEGHFQTMFGGEVSAATHLNVCPASEAASCKEGIEGTGPGQFKGLTGRSIAVDPEGTVYVGDENRVQRFSEEGVVEGEVAFSGVGRIENLAVDSAKDIYLHGRLQEGVHKYDPTGKEEGAPRDEAGFGAALAIAIGPADELLLNDLQESHHIFTFDPNGEQIASFDAGEESGLRGIAYSEFTKALYVLNKGAVRIVTPPPPGPFVLLGSEAASEVQPTTATLKATINPEGSATEYHFQYGTTTAYGQSTPVSAPLGGVNEVQSVTVAATGGAFTLAFKGASSAELPFNATAAEVQAALEAIPALGAGQVAVTGEPGGPWSVQFTGTRAGQSVPELSANAEKLTGPEPSAAVAITTPATSAFEDRPATAALTELLPSTTYHFRAVAENAAKEVTFGPDQIFVTLPPVSIDSTSASQVNATSARLEAELNPHGVASEYRFEYGTTTAYGTSIPIPDGGVGSGKADTTVENLIQGLLPSTTYHYRVIAHNALNKPGEVVEGPDRTFTTQGTASILPDGRTWELVSPPNKHGSPLEPLTEEGGLLQAAANGGAFAYVALGPINGEPKGVRSPSDTQLLATRGASGWSTQDITTPHEEISIIRTGFPSEYKFFAEDLSASAVQPEGVTPLSPKATERTPYRREANGEFVALVTPENTPPGVKFGGSEGEPGNGQWGNGVEFLTATPDLSHMILEAPQILAPGFKPGFEPNGQPNLYELTSGKLTLVSVLPNEEPAAEAGLTATVGRGNLNMRGALSSDGSRAVFQATKAVAHLYLRDVSRKETVQLDEPQPGAAGGTGAAEFQAASSDGRKVFFGDTSRLTANATSQAQRPDLYMCEVEVKASHLTCTLSDLSVDHNLGEAATVQAVETGQFAGGEVSAIDASGEHVYFAANGVLTSTPNPRGEVAVRGECKSEGEAACNLYSYDTVTHHIGLVAVLSSKDAPDWAGGGNLGNLTARSSPDGRFFTFMSQQSLTGYDNRDEHSGQRDEEVFLLDAETAKLSCVSCNPTGARPHGVFDKPEFPGLLVDHASSWGNKNGDPRWLAGSIPGWTLQWLSLATYQSRYLSNSGREFFTSSDALVPQDTNNVNDVYEFEPPGVGDCSTSAKTYSPTSGGCVSLVSSGSSQEESAFLDASESGDEAFFLTNSRLLGSDVDSSFDVYDAHVCSSSSPCPPPPSPPAPVCEGDSCQSPSSPPVETTPSSLTYRGPGNATPAPAAVVKPKAKPTRAQLLTKALKTCRRKKPKHRRVTCEKHARKSFGAKKASKAASHHTPTNPSRRTR